MSLRDSSIRHFIIHKGTIILLSHSLSFYLKRFKVAAVMLVIDLIVKRYKVRIFAGDIIQDRLFEAAPKIEVFEPEQITLVLYPLKDGFKIRDAGEYRGYETDCTDPCVIYLLHSSDAVSYTHLDVYKRQARNGHEVAGLNCADGLGRFDRLHLAAESRRDLGCQIAHTGIHLSLIHL